MGILAVVAIHCLRPFFHPEISRGEVWLAALLQFAVPGFFLASGLLSATREPVPWALTRARLLRLLVPYLIASAAAQAFRAYFGGEPLATRSMLADFLLGSSFGPYYYVVHAVLFVLVTPGLARLGPRALAGVSLAALLAQWISWGVPDLRWVAIHNPLHWFAFFLAGWWLRLAEPALGPALVTRRRLLVAGSAAGLALLSPHTLLGSPPVLAGSLQWWIVAFTLSLLFGSGFARQTRSRVVRFLSDASYTIYLAHLFFVLPVQRLRLPAPDVFDPVAIGAPFVAGLLGPLVLVVAARALLGARSRTWIGS